jgi:nitrogen PTS system EIIA component
MNNMVSQFLSPQLTRSKCHITSKKKALETVSQIVSKAFPSIDPKPILDSLIARERLGSTAIGDGIAVPHGKLCHCQHPMIVIMTLDEPVNFDAIDRKPVDIIVSFIIPEDADEEHLQYLSNIASLLKSDVNRKAIRQYQDSELLYSFFMKNLVH